MVSHGGHGALQLAKNVQQGKTSICKCRCECLLHNKAAAKHVHQQLMCKLHCSNNKLPKLGNSAAYSQDCGAERYVWYLLHAWKAYRDELCSRHTSKAVCRQQLDYAEQSMATSYTEQIHQTELMCTPKQATFTVSWIASVGTSAKHGLVGAVTCAVG